MPTGAGAKYARGQLIGALKILQRGDVSRNHLMGSWAGAMGHTQFIPTSYLAYAVDGDGDGRRDIWNSVPDALVDGGEPACAATAGRAGQTWGYEVILPPGRKFPGGSMSLSKWESIGVRRTNGKPFPRPGQNGRAEGAAGTRRTGLPDGEELLRHQALQQCRQICARRRSAGRPDRRLHPGPRKDWSRPFTKLSIAESEELQKRLKSAGFYEGEIDGKIGPASRSAILSFQAQYGLQRDGYASMELLKCAASAMMPVRRAALTPADQGKCCQSVCFPRDVAIVLVRGACRHVVLGKPGFDVDHAQARDSEALIERRSLLDLLFRRKEPAPQIQEVPKREVKRARVTPQTRQSAPASAPAAEDPRPPRRLENAQVYPRRRRFYRRRSRQGLEEAFEEVPSIRSNRAQTARPVSCATIFMTGRNRSGRSSRR
jgi:peptidoglycan hydrolase-like protein with peptidoglycan-binding domain